MTNVRKFARTMNEAFPNTVEYSCAIERPYYDTKKTWTRLALAVIAVGFVTMIVRIVIDYVF